MIDREGIPFILAGLLIAVAGGLASWPLALPGVVLTVFFVNFFRDPARRVPPGENAVSPADGRVIAVKGLDPAANEGYVQFISIFMNVLDVHVNRSPVPGRVLEYRHCPGKFLPAYAERAPFENERNVIVVEGAHGRLRFSQVAGILARRIVFRKRVGDTLEKGDRIGMIRFGSRVDIWLPAGLVAAVKPGDRVRAACTIIATKKTDNGNH
ncbi:MAG: phosphatidylserine decarboxylase [Acidobacteria bacterium]|nr:phosphatidylserine decarboxylase [Acidobacteriota bacterium]